MATTLIPGVNEILQSPTGAGNTPDAIQKTLTIDSTGTHRLIPIGTQQSAGAQNAGQAVVLNSAGFLDPTLFAPGFGADALQCLAYENIAAGSFVNIFNSGTQAAPVFSVRLADCTTPGKFASGFCPNAITAGQSGQVQFGGANSGLTGVIPGVMFLGTMGGFAAAPPSATGTIYQQLGYGTTPTQIDVKIMAPVSL